MRKLATAVAVLCLAASVALAGCSSSDGTDDASSGSSAVSTSVATTSTTTATTTAVPLVPAGDVDVQGFLGFDGKARCRGTDHAEMYMRTAESALVVCRSEINRLYYRGYRIVDGANIELYEVYPQGSGFVAVNSADNARYMIAGNGFQVIQNGSDGTRKFSPDVLTEIPHHAGGSYCSVRRVGAVAARWFWVRAWWSRSR